MLRNGAHTLSRSVGSTLAALLGASLLAPTGCNGGGTTGTDGGPLDAGTCAPDPLKTGLPPLFNGLSVDIYDCSILAFTAKYNEPDAMIFKAIV